MSAPPIGMTSATPKSSASPATAAITASCGTATQPATDAVRRRESTTIPPNRTLVTICCPEYLNAFGVMRPCSLPNATALPENETAPIMRPSIELIVSPGVTPAPVRPRLSSRIETRAAAPPPAPLKSAIICGIAVIFTTRAP